MTEQTTQEVFADATRAKGEPVIIVENVDRKSVV